MKIDRRNRVNLCKSDYQRSSYLDTVMIIASFGKEPGYGTGIILKDSKSGIEYLITAAHNIVESKFDREDNEYKINVAHDVTARVRMNNNSYMNERTITNLVYH